MTKNLLCIEMNATKYKIQLRIAANRDAKLLSDFTSFTFRESWLEEGNEQDLEMYVAENFKFEKIRNELSDPEILYLIIECDNIISGYCKLERNLNPDKFNLAKPICISRLYVKKEFHNLQLGSILINEALLIAAKEKFKTIWLGVWYKNPNAIRLYERFGFKKFGNYKFVMGNEISDDFLMKRKV